MYVVILHEIYVVCIGVIGMIPLSPAELSALLYVYSMEFSKPVK